MELDQIRWRTFLTLGILGLFFSLVVFFAGVDYIYGDGAYEDEEENEEAGWDMFYICLPLSLIPSIIFTAFGLKGRAEEGRLRDLGSYLQAYRRIKVAKVAANLQLSPYEAEKSILKCIQQGFVQGYIDRNTGEFFTQTAMWQSDQTQYGWKCTSCGGYNDQVVLPGEVGRCAFCGRVRPARAVEVNPMGK